MFGGHVLFGDCKEAGQTRLGGEQVIAVRIAHVGGDRKADGEKLFFRVEQEGEVHVLCETVGEIGDGEKACVTVLGCGRRGEAGEDGACPACGFGRGTIGCAFGVGGGGQWQEARLIAGCNCRLQGDQGRTGQRGAVPCGARNGGGIGQPVKEGGIVRRALRPVAAGACDTDQVACEIATVDR